MNQQQAKILKRLLLKTFKILLIVLLLAGGCEEIFRRRIGGWAGSYPFAETWEMYAREDKVIQAIKAVKEENAYLKPPEDSSYRNEYWYFIDFYYRDTKQVIKTWVRADADSATTTLAFVFLSDPANKEEDKFINRDYWYFANRREINKFEKQILEKIENKLYGR